MQEEKKDIQGRTPSWSQKETPAEKFTRLANQRVPNALKKIKLIGNLAASAYASTEEQIEKIITSLRQAVSEIEAKFKKGSKKEDSFSV